MALCLLYLAQHSPKRLRVLLRHFQEVHKQTSPFAYALPPQPKEQIHALSFL